MYLVGVLELNALDWQSAAGHRSATLTVPTGGQAGFTLLPPSATGITFTNFLAVSRYTTNQILLNGSGVAVGDVDGDGWCDLYFCGLDGPNRLYRNLRNLMFEDITATAGVACEKLDATGAVLADLDGDGDLDLVVNSVGQGTEVFFNDGHGRFTLVARLNEGKGGTSLALADYDGDGDLDLYVANYRTSTIRDQPNTRLTGRNVDGRMVVQKVNGRPVTEPDLVGRFSLDPGGKVIEHGDVDVLFRNDGGGKFAPVSFTGGAFLDERGQPLREPPYDWGLSVMFRDLNGDGAPDIYVCNDFVSEDRIWINLRDGRFQALAKVAVRSTSMYSMGVDVADVNRDGFDDIFVVDMLSRSLARRHNQLGEVLPTFAPIGQIDNRPQYSRNTLQVARGDGSFAELGQFAGIEGSEWSWTPMFIDVDLDGFEDLVITTGYERDAMNADVSTRMDAQKTGKQMSAQELLDMRRAYPRLVTAPVAYRNLGGLKFGEITKPWGLDHPGVAQGAVLADLDNDGDLDLVMNCMNGPAGICRNNASAPRLAVRLKGLALNSRGIGAKIKVTGARVVQSQEMISGGRYLSCDDAMRVFAAGDATNRLDIEVTWRNGRQSTLRQVAPNRVYEVSEEAAVAVAKPPRAPSTARLFEDVSRLLRHSHNEDSFDDFAMQPLLPRRLSQLGPGVTWFDVNGDGWEDLIVGSGRGGRLAVFLNDGKGGFAPSPDTNLPQALARDQTTVLGFGGSGGKTSLLIGSSSYEDSLSDNAAVLEYDLAGRTLSNAVPNQPWSTGPLALGDLDGDGVLELFVGGRVTPGRYPESASSMVYRRRGDHWELDAVNSKALAKCGLVSAAVWSDLDGDGYPELVLACEWGPIRVFQNHRGTLAEATAAWGLQAQTGWWNGVAVGDFDEDGRLDIVASNWGLNSAYSASVEHPAKLYYGGLRGAGEVDLVEARFDSGLGWEIPGRGLQAVGGALPFVREAVAGHEVYGRATLPQVYGNHFAMMSSVQAVTLDSKLFLNRGGRFEAASLPDEAQWSAAFGVCVGDFDGDGHEDLFLAQNFFAVNIDSARQDAGVGLCLKGDGRGRFTPLKGFEIGLRIFGEQRGCAVADFDGDGRLDLAVGQNGSTTRLLRNVGARPGLRVRLAGPAGNPRGVGARMRLLMTAQKGPVREVHAGSGYWSQDGAVSVLSLAGSPDKLWVQWPGGAEATMDLPTGATEVEVSAAGKVRKIR